MYKRRKRKQFSPDGVNNLEISVRPMRYRACNQAHNAEVEIWAIFATRNSLKLHMMQKLFSTISVPLLTDDSQIGANLRVCADEENRADLDQRGRSRTIGAVGSGPKHAADGGLEGGGRGG